VLSAWPAAEEIIMRAIPRSSAPGFIVFALCRKLSFESKLKRIYLNSLNTAVSKFPDTAVDLNGFFKIPYLLECKDSIQTLKIKLLDGESLLPEIVGNEEIVTFLCGTGGKRITNPVRGKRCKHFQCFDIEVFFNAKLSRCSKRDNVQCADTHISLAEI
jgi:hypothetical protein